MLAVSDASATESDDEAARGNKKTEDGEESGDESSSSNEGSDSDDGRAKSLPTHEYKTEEERIRFDPGKRGTSEHLQWHRALSNVAREYLNDAVPLRQQSAAALRYVHYISIYIACWYTYIYIYYIYIPPGR